MPTVGLGAVVILGCRPRHPTPRRGRRSSRPRADGEVQPALPRQSVTVADSTISGEGLAATDLDHVLLDVVRVLLQVVCHLLRRHAVCLGLADDVLGQVVLVDARCCAPRRPCPRSSVRFSACVGAGLDVGPELVLGLVSPRRRPGTARALRLACASCAMTCSRRPCELGLQQVLRHLDVDLVHQRPPAPRPGPGGGLLQTGPGPSEPVPMVGPHLLDGVELRGQLGELVVGARAAPGPGPCDRDLDVGLLILQRAADQRRA